MENRLHQRRSNGSRNDMAWNWLQRNSFHDDYIRDDEYITSIAATAFAIHSLEQAELHELQRMRERPESSRSQTMRRKEDHRSRTPSYGEISIKRSFGQDPRTKESAFPLRPPSSISSPSPRPVGYQKQQGIPLQNKNVKTRPETWEKAVIKLIQKLYEKMKSKILSWEFVKKIQAKLQRTREMHNYQNKMARMDMTEQGARAQLEDERKREGSETREKANRIRKSNQKPVKCLCFNS